VDVRVPRRRGWLVLVALVVFGAAAGGGVLWTRHRASAPVLGVPSGAAGGPVAGDPTGAAPGAGAAGGSGGPAIPGRAAPPPPEGRGKPPQGHGSAEPATRKQAAPAPARRHAQAIPPRPRGPVHVTFESQPGNAQVCFEQDRRLIGYTPRTIDLPADGRRVTFLVYLPAHRLRRVTVRADRDSRRTIQLEPVGADDLSPTGCLPANPR
jgi:hypothetical protein